MERINQNVGPLSINKAMETLRSMKEADLANLLRGEYSNLYRRMGALESNPRDKEILGGIVSAAARLSVLLREEERRGEEVIEVQFSDSGVVCQLKVGPAP